jgi:hypothetical protein
MSPNWMCTAAALRQHFSGMQHFGGREMNKFQAMFRTLAGILLLVLAVGLSYGQTDQGQIAGNVTDNTGASIPGVAITATRTETGTVYTAKSTSDGSYRFPSIQIGSYTVKATSPNFKQAVDTGVLVRVGTVTSLTISLTPGGATETVTVLSNAPTVETQSSDVGGIVTDRQIIELPLALGGVGAMRSPEAFAFLIPGTVGPGSGNNNNGIFISKIGGGQNFGNEILLDGASQTRSENGSSFDEEALSVEAISEFKVTTSTPAAEFGHTSGGIENFVTKSGTTSYHGSVFGIFRNEALDANDWFNNGRKAYYKSIGDTVDANNNRRPADKQYDFGISLGGPVSIPHIYNGRDRTFFFFSWEQYRLTAGGLATSNVPTLAERGGNFSDRLIGGPNGQTNPCTGLPILNGQIFDPATTRTVNGIRCRDPFPNNVIPTSRFSTVGQNITAFFPKPTNSALLNNYSLASSSALANTTYTVRIDESLGTKDKLFGSYSTRENTRDNPTFLTLPSPVDPGVQTQDFLTHFVRFGWDHFFTGSLLNHANLGWNRSNSINGSIEAGTGVNYNPQLGTPFTAGFPRVDVGGYVPLSRNQLGDNIDNGLRFNDDVSWEKGRNSFKAGIDVRLQQYSTVAKDQINGYLSFQAAQTKATQTGAYQMGTGNGFASLLLGQGDFASSTIRATQPRWNSNYYAGFIQDDLKVNKQLVLNIGLRYDIDQPRRASHNKTSNFSTTAIDPKSGLPGALVFGTTCTHCNPRWADTYYKDFAPRIGFAYTPSWWENKVVLRGGFSTLYAPLLYSDFGGDTIAGYNVPTIQASDGFDPAYSVDGGVLPTITGTNLDPGLFDNGNARSPRTFGNFIKPSYGRPGQINQWNLQVQQEVVKDLIFTLGYMGSSGSHLHSGNENINNIAPSNFSRGDALTNYNLQANGVASPYSTFNGNVQQALRPFPQYGFIATDCCLQNTGHSTYNALIASIDRRFSQGLSLKVSYTWSKDLTNADSALPGINGGSNQVQNPFNGKSQKSLSIQDIPHTLVTSFIYELPFGKDKRFLNFNNSIARAVFSGFEIGGVLRYQSGEPISFAGATGIPGFDNHIDFTRIPGSRFTSKARAGHIDPFRILRAGLAVPAGPDPNVDSEFNGLSRTDNAGYSAFQTAPAFYDQNSGPNRILRARQVGTCDTCDNGGYQFGNIPRVSGDIRNYLYNNEDFSFLKKTPLGDRVTFFLKAEFLNAFNRHIFGTPDTNPYDLYFGVPTYTIDGSRKIQLTGRFQF